MKAACPVLFAVLLATLSVAHGAGSGEALREPQVLAKAIAALEISKIDELTSRKDEQGSSYHLRKAEFLGTVSRNKRIYTIVHATYVRSSPPGKETPPPRGHDFIVVFDPGFHIAAHGRTDFGKYRMEGEKLYYDESPEPCADFGSAEPSIRHGGYFSINLPYPFADRISDADWESGAFRKKP